MGNQKKWAILWPMATIGGLIYFLFGFTHFFVNYQRILLCMDEYKENILPNETVIDIDSIGSSLLNEIFVLPQITINDMLKGLVDLPINKKSGKKMLMFSVVNSGMIDFITNMLCSLKLAGINKKHHVTLALDEESYQAITKIGMQAILVRGHLFSKNAVNMRNIVQFSDIVKMKLAILFQYLKWGIEAILIDADVVILENPLAVFNNDADFEVQSDSAIIASFPYEIDKTPFWELNLGFFKVNPSPIVLRVMEDWISLISMSNKSLMQGSLFNLLGKYPRKWIGNDTFEVDLSHDYPNIENLTKAISFRYLDPLLIANPGGIYFKGEKAWAKEAKLRHVKRPKLIHYFHISFIKEKRRMLNKTKMWFINGKTQKCIDSQTIGVVDFPPWKSVKKKDKKGRKKLAKRAK